MESKLAIIVCGLLFLSFVITSSLMMEKVNAQTPQLNNTTVQGKYPQLNG